MLGPNGQQVPVVDMNNLHNTALSQDDPKFVEIAQNFGNALHDHGILYMSNHGIPDQVIQAAFEETKKFFQLPPTAKAECERKVEKGLKHLHGYSTPRHPKLLNGGESVWQLRENFEVIQKNRFWPTRYIPRFQWACESLETACRSLATKILKILAVAIDLEDPNFFLEANSNLVTQNGDNFSHLYASYYSPITNDGGQEVNEPGNHPPDMPVTRCAEHTDSGMLTLLFQDSMGGLEVKKDNLWTPASPIDGTIVVNIGDLLETWTSGYFPATVHQVVVPGDKVTMARPRQSMAFFVYPDEYFVVEPLPSTNVLPTPTPKLFKSTTTHQIFEERAKKLQGMKKQAESTES